jgi:hypothetical protein
MTVATAAASFNHHSTLHLYQQIKPYFGLLLLLQFSFRGSFITTYSFSAYRVIFTRRQAEAKTLLRQSLV